jgi:hypothetical protein
LRLCVRPHPPFPLPVKKQTPVNSTGNEPYGCRTPAVELETGERLVRLVKLSPPPSIVEYLPFGNEGTLGLGVRLLWIFVRKVVGAIPRGLWSLRDFLKVI